MSNLSEFDSEAVRETVREMVKIMRAETYPECSYDDSEFQELATEGAYALLEEIEPVDEITDSQFSDCIDELIERAYSQI